MVLQFANVENVYNNNKDLKKENVDALLDWAQKQPHLPKINELQAILFLHSCYYNNEAAKTTIDNFFTFRTLHPEFMANQNITTSKELKEMVHTAFDAALPQKTPEGHTIIYMQLLDTNPDLYSLPGGIKFFDMVAMLDLHQQGPSEGLVVILNCKGATIGHMTKISFSIAKKFLYYLQEAMPVRLKAVHVFNVVPVIEKIYTMIKPLMKKQLVELIHLYQNVDEMCKVVPRECLPGDVGGSQEAPVAVLHEKNKDLLIKSTPFFEWLETLKVDENRRQGKSKIVENSFGTDGTFKKLELD